MEEQSVLHLYNDPGSTQYVYIYLDELIERPTTSTTSTSTTTSTTTTTKMKRQIKRCGNPVSQTTNQIDVISKIGNIYGNKVIRRMAVQNSHLPSSHENPWQVEVQGLRNCGGSLISLMVRNFQWLLFCVKISYLVCPHIRSMHIRGI